MVENFTITGSHQEKQRARVLKTNEKAAKKTAREAAMKKAKKAAKKKAMKKAK